MYTKIDVCHDVLFHTDALTSFSIVYQTYKSKLKELKRVSRALFKRVKEAEARPKLLAKLAGSFNISQDFLARMKNLTSEVQIFTEVEITTLENLIEETGVREGVCRRWGRQECEWWCGDRGIKEEGITIVEKYHYVCRVLAPCDIAKVQVHCFFTADPLPIYSPTRVTLYQEIASSLVDPLPDTYSLQEWATKKITEQEALPPHEEPVLLAYEIEEQNKRLDREIMYLLKKLRSHPPPKIKVPTNKTNDTTINETKVCFYYCL